MSKKSFQPPEQVFRTLKNVLKTYWIEREGGAWRALPAAEKANPLTDTQPSKAVAYRRAGRGKINHNVCKANVVLIEPQDGEVAAVREFELLDNDEFSGHRNRKICPLH